MGDLLLKEDLLRRSGDVGEPVRNVAQTLTTTILRTLDQDRRNIAIQFLRDSTLANSLLIGASLEGIDLHGTNLSGITMNKANLTKADMSMANLRDTNLAEAILMDTNLSGAGLFNTDLRSAALLSTNLRSANIGDANLEGTSLFGADLTGVSLYRIVSEPVEQILEVMMNQNTSGWEVFAGVKNLVLTKMPDGKEYDKNIHEPLILNTPRMTQNLITSHW